MRVPFIPKAMREIQESGIFEGLVSPGGLFLKCRIGVGLGMKRRVGKSLQVMWSMQPHCQHFRLIKVDQ